MEQQHGRRENREEALARRGPGAAQALVRRGTISARRGALRASRPGEVPPAEPIEQTAAGRAGAAEEPPGRGMAAGQLVSGPAGGDEDGAAAFDERANAYARKRAGAAVMAPVPGPCWWRPRARKRRTERRLSFWNGCRGEAPGGEGARPFIPCPKGGVERSGWPPLPGAAKLQGGRGGGPRGTGREPWRRSLPPCALLANARSGARCWRRPAQVERLLRQDPAGVYPKMDEVCRARYRHEVCRQARRTGEKEAGDWPEHAPAPRPPGEGPPPPCGVVFVPGSPWAARPHTAPGHRLPRGGDPCPPCFWSCWRGSPSTRRWWCAPAAPAGVRPGEKTAWIFWPVRLVPPRPVLPAGLREGFPPRRERPCASSPPS